MGRGGKKVRRRGAEREEEEQERVSSGTKKSSTGEAQEGRKSVEGEPWRKEEQENGRSIR
jgi:hypothetical protein